LHLINNAWCRVKDWDRGRATTMKILVVHPHLNLVGGSEILTKILVYELAGQGHEVIVVTKDRREDLFPDAPNVRFEFIKDIPELYKLSLRKMTTGKIMTLFYTLDHAIETHEPEVALVMIQEPIYAALIKFSRPGLGTALYIHYPFEEELTPQNLAKFIDMYRFPDLYVSLYKVADLHMTNSNYTAKILHKRFGIESNVVYPAVDWKFFENEPSLSDDRGNVIITVGRFVPHKRQDLMIEMFAKRIRPVVKDAQLVVVGMVDVRYEDYYAKLRRLSQETEGGGAGRQVPDPRGDGRDVQKGQGLRPPKDRRALRHGPGGGHEPGHDTHSTPRLGAGRDDYPGQKRLYLCKRRGDSRLHNQGLEHAYGRPSQDEAALHPHSLVLQPGQVCQRDSELSKAHDRVEPRILTPSILFTPPSRPAFWAQGKETPLAVLFATALTSKCIYMRCPKAYFLLRLPRCRRG